MVKQIFKERESLSVPAPTRYTPLAQTVKRLSTMWETWVQSLGREDPLKKEMAIHSSTIAWKIPWTEEPGRAPVHGVVKSQTRLSDFTFIFPFHALNLDWPFISHVVIYMLQCYSLKSSHLHLLPQSPKVCSLHLCLLCCLAYRVIITIFLNSIYVR